LLTFHENPETTLPPPSSKHDVSALLEEARRIVGCVERIVDSHYGSSDLIDGRLVAHAAYDQLIQFLGDRGSIHERRCIRTEILKDSWWPWSIAKLLYHISFSRLHHLTKKTDLSSIRSAILLLPGVRSRPNLLSRLEDNLKEGYPVVMMTVTSNNLPWEIRNLSYRDGLPSVETHLTSSDIVRFLRISFRILSDKANFVRSIEERVFCRYGINSVPIRSRISAALLSALLDNVEYGIIGERLSEYSPCAVVSEVANYGKIAYILSNLNRRNVCTVGIQHGVMIDPYEYIPAAKRFGCPSPYSLKLLTELTSRVKGKDSYFLCGLPEQLSHTKKSVARKGSGGFGFVDSNETVKLYKELSVQIIKSSTHVATLPKLFVKSHPRAKQSMKIESWFMFPRYVSMGIVTWDDFCKDIEVSITLSFDAIYELLAREIVTVVINPGNRFQAGNGVRFNNLTFVCNSFELDSALSEISERETKWVDREQKELDAYLGYVFGSNSSRHYGHAVRGIIDEHTRKTET